MYLRQNTFQSVFEFHILLKKRSIYESYYLRNAIAHKLGYKKPSENFALYICLLPNRDI